jgi:trk system potassium uptake protein TrkA
MRVIVLGAGHVGQTVVDVLHDEHDLTVIDVHAERLSRLANRYDVRTVVGDGTTRQVVRRAGVEAADLLLACCSREEANLVCGMLVKRMSNATAVVRTTSTELFEAWREGEIDVDVMVSPELETARAIVGVVALPAARHTDTFADGKVRIVEFDVPERGAPAALVGPPLRHAAVPADSKVAGLVRGGEARFGRGDERILPGDRVVVIASPQSARAWSRALAGEAGVVHDVVVFGGGQMGMAIAQGLVGSGLRVRLVESDAARAEQVAAELPDVTVLRADAFDRAFVERQRMTRAAAVFALNDDAKNLFAATLAKVHGVRLTITLMHDPSSADVYERGGVDVAVNPRELTAGQMVRFAHGKRIRQIAMLERHRLEVVDIDVRPDSELVGLRLADLTRRDAFIGAVIRDGVAMFPHGDDALRGGDRVILLVDAASLTEAARLL